MKPITVIDLDKVINEIMPKSGKCYSLDLIQDNKAVMCGVYAQLQIADIKHLLDFARFGKHYITEMGEGYVVFKEVDSSSVISLTLTKE